MKIGILGGGQLSRMLACAGIPLGYQFVFYFPAIPHALHNLGEIIHGDYQNETLLQQFAAKVDVITYENENIAASTVSFLQQFKPVYPDVKALTCSQDRWQEKNFFRHLQIPTNLFLSVNNRAELTAAAEQLGYPFILKKRTQGYDGKGQIKIISAAQLAAITDDALTHAIAEQFVTFDREVSIIAARNRQQQTVFYDVCENLHRQAILIKTQNQAADPMFAQGQQYVENILQALDYYGVLAVEFFQVGQQLLANEMAPRVHNSGHWTIDACITSQFENHLRAISGMPLGSPQSLTAACLYNILSQMPAHAELLQFEGLKLHDYGKTPAPGRKLGHVTLLKILPPEQVAQLEKILGIN